MSIRRRFAIWLFLLTGFTVGLFVASQIMCDSRLGRAEISYSELVRIGELSRADTRERSHPRFRNPVHPYYFPYIRNDSLGRTIVLLKTFGSCPDAYSVIPDEKKPDLEQLLEPLRKYNSGHCEWDATSIAILLPCLILLSLTSVAISRNSPSANWFRNRVELFTNAVLNRSFCAGLGAVLSSLLAILGFCWGSL